MIPLALVVARVGLVQIATNFVTVMGAVKIIVDTMEAAQRVRDKERAAYKKEVSNP